MACRPPGSGSYTVVIIPLKTSLYSLDALRFYLWIGSAHRNKALGPLEDNRQRCELWLVVKLVRRLRDLEQEKDALCSGLEILEKARLWYLQRLEENRTKQINTETKSGVGSCQGDAAEAQSCLLRYRIQRVNGSLGSVMSEPNVTSCSNQSVPDTVADSDLRWHNTVLTQEVSDKNRQISMLELEKDALLEKLDELQAH